MEEFQEISLDEIMKEVEEESLSTKIKKRKSNLNNENFELDVKMFEAQLNMCEKPEENFIYKEISSWDFTTPTKECFDRNEIVKVYAKLNAYRHRLAEMIGQCSRYHKIASTAHKSLKETAHALYTGTASERNANAGYRVRPFELESLYAEGLVVYLTETQRALDSMFINLSANLKHIDNLMRVNHSYEDEGISLNYMSMHDADQQIEEQNKVMGMRVRTLGSN